MKDDYITLYFLYDRNKKKYIDVATSSTELAINNGVSPVTVRASIHRYETGQIKKSKYKKERMLKDEVLDIFCQSDFIDELNEQ